MKQNSKIAACILPRNRFKGVGAAGEAFIHAPGAMAIVDAELHLLDCNNSFLNIFNSTRQSEGIAWLARYLDQADCEQILNLIDQSLGEKNLKHQTACLGNGTLLVTFQPLIVSGVACFLLSFESRPQTEESFEGIRQRLLMVVEGVSVGLIIIDAESSRIVDINNQALQLFGCSRDQIYQRDCHEYLGLEPGVISIEQAAGLLHGKKRMLRTADGIQRQVLFSVKRSHFKNQDYFLVSLTDTSLQHSAELEVSQLVNFDPTTNLPNRTLLLEHMHQALSWAKRMQGSTALLLLDLDHFKDFNDSLGHASGDRLLALLGERLKRCVRQADTVARVGGDEFAILLTDIPSVPQVTAIADKILARIAEPCSIEGREYHLTASLGISSYPFTANEPEEMICQADTAMYRAKHAGRNQVQIFSPEMNAENQQRLLLINDLHQALSEQQFEVYYQPQVDLRTGGICGTEALLRWRHPSMGMIPPDQFIPVAEETGLIVPLGLWVLETACRQVGQWQRSLMVPLRLAVNLSAGQFRQADLALDIGRVLTKTKFSAALLELELTESMLMEPVAQAQQAMEKLKKMGVTLAIDDFGTGYSSLSYLKHFPLDRLKIDQSFVRELAVNPADAAIVEAIIAMAGRLGLEIIAEGVEEEAQAEFLLANGCYEIQGFLFGQPVAAAEFTKKLQDQQGLTLDLRADLPCPI